MDIYLFYKKVKSKICGSENISNQESEVAGLTEEIKEDLN